MLVAASRHEARGAGGKEGGKVPTTQRVSKRKLLPSIKECGLEVVIVLPRVPIICL